MKNWTLKRAVCDLFKPRGLYNLRRILSVAYIIRGLYYPWIILSVDCIIRGLYYPRLILSAAYFNLYNGPIVTSCTGWSGQSLVEVDRVRVYRGRFNVRQTRRVPKVKYPNCKNDESEVFEWPGSQVSTLFLRLLKCVASIFVAPKLLYSAYLSQIRWNKRYVFIIGMCILCKARV